jgi:hypothetical protein
MSNVRRPECLSQPAQTVENPCLPSSMALVESGLACTVRAVGYPAPIFRLLPKVPFPKEASLFGRTCRPHSTQQNLSLFAQFARQKVSPSVQSTMFMSISAAHVRVCSSRKEHSRFSRRMRSPQVTRRLRVSGRSLALGCSQMSGSLWCFRCSFRCSVQQPPNPSIERTCPGKPGHASHLKRWASAK